ncbi:MAG: hypothetical protein K0R65_928 [Crocinitomicaceae bacterium]|jgi:hypothetical protein|nr:hypothetical protein [Crocinitomicaceae bacterium]
MLALLVGIVLFFVKWCSGSSAKSRFEIENSPIRVEMIRNIAQLANISYKDEVVADSIEYYKSENEMFAGTFEKLGDPDNFRHGLKASNVKRRLTLIVKGEVWIGFNLKDEKFNIKETDSLIQIFLPEPEIIDVISTATSTKVFQENGRWKDYEIRQLKNKARQKMRRNAEMLRLQDKAKENAKNVLGKLIKKKKPVEFVFV